MLFIYLRLSLAVVRSIFSRIRVLYSRIKVLYSRIKVLQITYPPKMCKCANCKKNFGSSQE